MYKCVRPEACGSRIVIDRSARAHNVRDAVRVRHDARLGSGASFQPGRRPTEADHQTDAPWIVLVDDVLTTGSTLAACAETLLEAGAFAVSAVTVARER